MAPIVLMLTPPDASSRIGFPETSRFCTACRRARTLSAPRPRYQCAPHAKSNPFHAKSTAERGIAIDFAPGSASRS
eukprot:3416868-Rhodomonas_salina.2